MESLMKISNNVRKAAKEQTKQLMKKKGVVGVGVGEKWSKGVATGSEAIVVLVKEKKDIAALEADSVIPTQVTVNGVTVQTDVIAVGEIRAYVGEENRKLRRPIQAGISVGHYKITSGTIGLIVQKDGEDYILSNNHVLANSNAATIGDPVYQPGPADGGGASNQVAKLSHFIPIDFTPGANNLVDCALAKIIVAPPVVEPPPTEEPPPVVTPPKKKKLNFFQKIIEWLKSLFGKKRKASSQGVTVIIGGDEQPPSPTTPIDIKSIGEVYGIGAVTGNIDATPNVGDVVQKSGRTTGYTTNKVIAIDVTATVSYGLNQEATFVNQILCGDMSDGGDSGSAVFNENKDLVGLLFAGSDTVTILNPMGEVFIKLGIARVKL
jgi:hypothetical protein